MYCRPMNDPPDDPPDDVWQIEDDGEVEGEQPQLLTADTKEWEQRWLKYFGTANVEWDSECMCADCTGGRLPPPRSTRQYVEPKKP
jgi:hypothetical protein